jgi:adenosylcobinamide kinase/adenosylcobinamide-phosphate guanylyltransferase
MVTLVTGPVRSGKSRFALELARESGREPVFVATAVVDPNDAEMTARVARHRAERGAMRCIETDERAGPRLAGVLAAASPAEILIVDSLGTWLSSILVQTPGEALESDAAPAADENDLLAAITAMKSDAVIVAEEAGWGVVPAYPLGRAFRDRLGRLTGTLAGRADRAYLIVAGYALDLRAAGRRVSG